MKFRVPSRLLTIGLAAVIAALVAIVATISPSRAMLPMASSSSSSGSSSSSSSTTALRVVDLGDSVESGYNCDCTNFVQQVGDRLAAAQSTTASVDNTATAGATSADVLAKLQTASVQAAIRDSDVVVIEIGANDFDESDASDTACLADPAATCYASAASTLTSNIDTIVSTVTALQQNSGAKVVVMGYWNVFTDGAVAQAKGSTYVTVSRELTAWTNALMKTTAAKYGAVYADAATPFTGSSGTANDTAMLASDGDHPDAEGHAALASAVVSSLGSAAATV